MGGTVLPQVPSASPAHSPLRDLRPPRSESPAPKQEPQVLTKTRAIPLCCFPAEGPGLSVVRAAALLVT